jgi:hypothetical protein
VDRNERQISGAHLALDCPIIGRMVFEKSLETLTEIFRVGRNPSDIEFEFDAIESAGAFVVQENISRRKTHDIAIIHYHIGALQNCDIVKLAEILRGIE